MIAIILSGLVAGIAGSVNVNVRIESMMLYADGRLLRINHGTDSGKPD